MGNGEEEFLKFCKLLAENGGDKRAALREMGVPDDGTIDRIIDIIAELKGELKC